jgi:hypothetical protein
MININEHGQEECCRPYSPFEATKENELIANTFNLFTIVCFVCSGLFIDSTVAHFAVVCNMLTHINNSLASGISVWCTWKWDDGVHLISSFLAGTFITVNPEVCNNFQFDALVKKRGLLCHYNGLL